MKTKKKLNTEIKRRRRIMGVILVVAACLTIGTLVMASPMVLQGTDTSAIIRIPRNATSQNVSDSIKEYLGEEYAEKVMTLLKIRKIDWGKRHGAYLVKQGFTPYETMRLITRGAQVPVRLTINDIRGEKLLAERIAAKLDFTPEEFLKELHSEETLSKYGLKSDEVLALFMNDTYEVYWSSSPKTVIDKIGKYYQQYWTPERTEKASGLGLTPAETATLSSIVSEETNASDEKGRIGRLYINRLQKGMKLQSDPTVRFAIGDYTIKRVKGEHLKYESPYNTYLHAGLPPGPIRTPSKSTIDAVLKSEPSEDLYMCAKEDFSGRHNFAVTYEEHLQNARKYQAELDRRGIK